MQVVQQMVNTNTHRDRTLKKITRKLLIRKKTILVVFGLMWAIKRLGCYCQNRVKVKLELFRTEVNV